MNKAVRQFIIKGNSGGYLNPQPIIRQSVRFRLLKEWNMRLDKDKKSARLSKRII